MLITPLQWQLVLQSGCLCGGWLVAIALDKCICLVIRSSTLGLLPFTLLFLLTPPTLTLLHQAVHRTSPAAPRNHPKQPQQLLCEQTNTARTVWLTRMCMNVVCSSADWSTLYIVSHAPPCWARPLSTESGVSRLRVVLLGTSLDPCTV